MGIGFAFQICGDEFEDRLCLDELVWIPGEETKAEFLHRQLTNCTRWASRKAVSKRFHSSELSKVRACEQTKYENATVIT